MTATTRLTGSSTKSWLATTAIFLAGYYSLPTQRARKFYLLTWGSAIGGFWPGMERVPDQDGTFGDWLGGWDVTFLSFMFWGAAIYFLFAMIGEVRAWKRYVRYYQTHPTVNQVQVDRAGPVHEAPKPTPAPTPAPAPAAAPAPGPKPAEADVPEIIIPSTLMGRRVRRVGTTPSGVPIKDRRTVDPHTLRPREHD